MRMLNAVFDVVVVILLSLPILSDVGVMAIALEALLSECGEGGLVLLRAVYQLTERAHCSTGSTRVLTMGASSME